MIDLLELSEKYIGQVQLNFNRYLLHQINWNNRLIGIKGARRSGKTTLLLHWLRSRDLSSGEACIFL